MMSDPPIIMLDFDANWNRIKSHSYRAVMVATFSTFTSSYWHSGNRGRVGWCWWLCNYWPGTHAIPYWSWCQFHPKCWKWLHKCSTKCTQNQHFKVYLHTLKLLSEVLLKSLASNTIFYLEITGHPFTYHVVSSSIDNKIFS